MNQVKAICIIILLLLVVILVVQNYETLSTPVHFGVDFKFFSYESSSIPVSVVMVLTFLVGVFATGLYGLADRFRLKRQVKDCLKSVKEKDKEIISLRNLPVIAEDMSQKETLEPQEKSF